MLTGCLSANHTRDVRKSAKDSAKAGKGGKRKASIDEEDGDKLLEGEEDDEPRMANEKLQFSDSEDAFNRAQTPEQEEEEETEDESDVVPRPSSNHPKKASNQKTEVNSVVEDLKLPPKRDLPFTSKAAVQSPSRADQQVTRSAAAAAGDEDETDDEL